MTTLRETERRTTTSAAWTWIVATVAGCTTAQLLGETLQFLGYFVLMGIAIAVAQVIALALTRSAGLALVWLVVTPLGWTVGALLAVALPAAGLENMASPLLDQVVTLTFGLMPWLLLAIGQAIVVQVWFGGAGRPRVFGRWVLAVFGSAGIATALAFIPPAAGLLDHFSALTRSMVHGAVIGLLVGMTSGLLLQRLRAGDQALTSVGQAG